MSGGKETGRQKMIGMMYLVLTALLALNISAEAIKAFGLIRKGLDETTANFDSKISFTFSAFDNAMKNDAEKTKPYLDKAKAAKAMSQELFDYIEVLKEEMIEMGGGYAGEGDEKNIYEIKGEKDLDKAAELMITKGKGPELKDKINETRDKMLALVDPTQRAELNLTLSAEDPPASEDGLALSWESYMFEGKPLTAAVALLSKLQTDVRNAELDIVNFLFKAISASDFKFDQLEATVIPGSDYVLTGQEYNAKIFISASSSTQDPEVYIGSVDEEGKLKGEGTLLPVEDGKAVYKTVPSREGVVEWGGVIQVKKPGSNEVTSYPFKKSFIAAKSSVVVSADKMNVLYIGVPNPMSISAPGIPNEKVTARFKGNGRFTGNGRKGSYTAMVTTPGTTKIEVIAELPSGEKKVMGFKEYRIKTVPPPTPKFAGKNEGTVSRGELKVQRGIFAELENFDFDLKYTVTKYRFIMTRKSNSPIIKEGRSQVLSSDVVAALGRADPGERVLFDQIYAKGPDGKEVKVAGTILLDIK
jgi:gliding motility-associated protein GldM